MKKSLLILCTLIIVTCTPKNPDVDYIINKYIEARGGLEKIKEIDSKIFIGHYIEPGYNWLMDAQVKQKRPYYRVVGDTSRGFAEGFDGSSWEYFREKGFIRTTGEAEAATRRGSEFDVSLIEYENKGHYVELLGHKIINGTNTYEIEVTLNDGWKKIYYIDTSSYLIIALRKAMPLHAVGDDIDYLVTVTDYRQVNDVLYPFTQIERDFHSNKMISSTIWDTLIVNEELPDSVFSP